MDRIPSQRVYLSPQTGSQYALIPVFVRPLPTNDGRYRVRVDLRGLAPLDRSTVVDAFAPKDFHVGYTALDMSHVSRVCDSDEVGRVVGHAAATYMRALTSMYGSGWLDTLRAIQESESESESAEPDDDDDF